MLGLNDPIIFDDELIFHILHSVDIGTIQLLYLHSPILSQAVDRWLVFLISERRTIRLQGNSETLIPDFDWWRRGHHHFCTEILHLKPFDRMAEPKSAAIIKSIGRSIGPIDPSDVFQCIFASVDNLEASSIVSTHHSHPMGHLRGPAFALQRPAVKNERVNRLEWMRMVASRVDLEAGWLRDEVGAIDSTKDSLFDSELIATLEFQLSQANVQGRGFIETEEHRSILSQIIREAKANGPNLAGRACVSGHVISEALLFFSNTADAIYFWRKFFFHPLRGLDVALLTQRLGSSKERLSERQASIGVLMYSMWLKLVEEVLSSEIQGKIEFSVNRCISSGPTRLHDRYWLQLRCGWPFRDSENKNKPKVVTKAGLALARRDHSVSAAAEVNWSKATSKLFFTLGDEFNVRL